MEEDDMVKSMAIASYRDEAIRREGWLQAPESSRACTRVRVKRSLTIILRGRATNLEAVNGSRE